MPHEVLVVYVEDDKTSREVMEIMLRLKMGMQNLVLLPNSASFESFLDQLTIVPEIFFLDIHVAPFNGFDMLDMIRSRKNLSNAMVIAVTASVMNEEVEQLRKAGFNGAIAKPLDADLFPLQVKQLLARQEVWFIVS